MSTTAYDFKRTDGTHLGTILSLENNGPGATTVPLQVSDIDFSVEPPVVVVDGNVTSSFPEAAVNAVTISSVDVLDRWLVLATPPSISEQLYPGMPIQLVHTPTNAVHSYLIVNSGDDAGNLYVEVNADLPANIADWVDNGEVTASTVRAFTLEDGAYSDAVYLAAPEGATFVDGKTHIPVHPTTPLAMPAFSIIMAVPGGGGAIVVEAAANGSCQFRPGSTFSIESNSMSGANASYIVSTSVTSGTYTVTEVNADNIVVAGDVRGLAINGKKIAISGGQAHNVQLTVASTTIDVTGNHTIIEVIEPIPSTVVPSTNMVCVPATTLIQVAGTLPVGMGADGVAIPAAPSAFTFSAPPAITPNGPNNHLVSWRISGDHTSKFTSGCPVLIKGNSFFEYQELPVHSASFSSGMTHVVTIISGHTTPTPDASGSLIYPAPTVKLGKLSYSCNAPFTSLKLVGKGSPIYNHDTSWGQAIQDNVIHLTENFASGLEVVPVGLNGDRFTLPFSLLNHRDLVVGAEVRYRNDSGDPTIRVYEISNVFGDGVNLFVDVIPSVEPTFVGDGAFAVAGTQPVAPMAGQLWYDRGGPQLYAYTYPDEYHGVVIQTVPAMEYVDMGEQQIKNMADPIDEMDAVNLQTADRLYIAKTGGYSSNANVRSGSMVGSLNFGPQPAGADWSYLGINMNDADITMYSDASVVFDSQSTGGVFVEGTGNVWVLQGNVRVGDGATNFVTIQNNPTESPTITFTTDSVGNDSLNMGSNKIVNVSTPENANDAANKSYVDSLANGIVWLQPVIDPNLFSDSTNIPPFIQANVVGVSTGPTNYWKVAGNHASSFTAGQILTITENDDLDANQAYVVVSAANNGANTDITVAANTIPVGATSSGVASDTSVPTHKTYIVGSSPTGDWTGLARHAVVYTVLEIDPVSQAQTWGWLDIMGRPVQAGDRFGMFVEPDAEDPLNVLPSGSLSGQVGKIATVATVAPLTYTFYTPTEPYAFSVTGVSPTLTSNSGSTQSPHFGHSYTFRGTWGSGDYGVNYKWIEFAGPSMLAAGGGLKYSGNVLNVGAGAGIIVNADTVQLDNTYASGIYVRRDGMYAMTGDLQLGGNKITNVGIPTLGGDAANKTYTDNQDSQRVAKTGDTMSGTLTFTSGTVTGVAYPVANQDVASKVYADNQDSQRVAKTGDTMTGNLVMVGAGVGITLPNAPAVSTDAVNKQYADSKLSLAGGTMTGALVLAANPVGNMEAATKQYADNNFVRVTQHTSLNAGINVTFTGGGEVLGLPVTPTTSGSATSKGYVDNQLLVKADDAAVMHLAGTETVTGNKTLVGTLTANNAVQVAANGSDVNLNVTSSAITIVGTPVSSGGASSIGISGGVNTGGIGGNVALVGGNGSTSGGNITLTSGQGSAGAGGNITITTGTGTTTSGQLSLTAGNASLLLQPTGVWQVGGLTPTAASQALCSNVGSPAAGTPTWQLVGTRVAAAPANSSSPGIPGNWFADDSFFYVYGATGWRRIATTTF